MRSLKNLIKYIFALIFHYSGYNCWVMNRCKLHYILMFHRLDKKHDIINISIPVNFFGTIVEWSKEMGDVVNMTDLISAKKQEIRFCMTFDDGYSTVKRISEVALGVPSVLYLATAFIETGKEFWATELDNLISCYDKNSLDLTSFHLGIYDLSSVAYKKLVIYELNLQMKSLHPSDIRAIIIYLRLISAKELVSNNEFLCWKEIRELMSNGMEVGGHTHNHAISSRVTPEEFRNEIVISNECLNRNIYQEVKHFAYPNGQFQDISLFSRQILKDEGYESAVSTIEGPNNINDDPYCLKRFNVSTERIASPWGTPSKAMFTTMLVNPINFH